MNLKNTILAGNFDNSPSGSVNPDCSGTITSHDYNLFGDLGSGPCLVVGTIDHDILGGNLLLDPLADNGGGTQTHALLTGSPAIDYVGDCTDLAGDPITTDQRGVSRPQSTACDIGAYEKGVPVLAIGKFVAPETAVAYSGLVTYTITVSNSGIVTATNVQITDTLCPPRWILATGLACLRVSVWSTM